MVGTSLEWCVQVRCYLHYQPSYYHLHVHVTAIDYTPPGANC